MALTNTEYFIQTPTGAGIATDLVVKAAARLAAATASMKNWDRRERGSFDDEDRFDALKQYASDIADITEAFAALMVAASEDIADSVPRFGNSQAAELSMERCISEAMDELYLPSVEQAGDYDFSARDE